MNTEGVDDRERAVMGSFKDLEITRAVRECIMNHIADFNDYIKKMMSAEKMIQLADAKQHQVCPQSIMMLAELFHHFFDYCDEKLFIEALEKVFSFYHILFYHILLLHSITFHHILFYHILSYHVIHRN